MPDTVGDRMIEDIPTRTTDKDGTYRVCPNCQGDGHFVYFDDKCVSAWAHDLLNGRKSLYPRTAMHDILLRDPVIYNGFNSVLMHMRGDQFIFEQGRDVLFNLLVEVYKIA